MDIIRKWNETSFILRILGGLILGAVLGLVAPQLSALSILGSLFVGALKAIAPILVFFLVVSSISKAHGKIGARFRTVIILYMVSTLLAAIVAVFMSFAFPVSMKLTGAANNNPPGGVVEVLTNLVSNMVSNPFMSMATANYTGILFWAVVTGLALKQVASAKTIEVIGDISDAVSIAVRWVIQLAPFGILGLVFSSVSESGLAIFTDYGKLLLVLVGSMALVSLVINPIIASCLLKRNAYPLILKCLRESGLTAFFTRSSAANIPVNMELCERLGLEKDFYSIAIPLGATINMDGAAITITVMTLAAATTVGITVDIPSAIILSFLATIAACGASGVAGGSLLLIPMACSMFGISADIAMQVVAVGFIIGVVQDSVETALNSSGDVFFAATAEYYDRKRQGKPMNFLNKD